MICRQAVANKYTLKYMPVSGGEMDLPSCTISNSDSSRSSDSFIEEDKVYSNMPMMDHSPIMKGFLSKKTICVNSRPKGSMERIDEKLTQSSLNRLLILPKRGQYLVPRSISRTANRFVVKDRP